MDHLEHCDLLEAEVERFAALIEDAPLGTPVPSCPGWSVEDVTTHLGTIHRWAEHLVQARAPKRIAAASMGLGQPEPSAPWVRSGGEKLVATLRSADPESPMWAWGADQRVRFWSRRQLHETLVHRMDVELALGHEPATSPAPSPATASDGIDEFLANLAPAAYFSPKVKNLRGQGAALVFRATDEDRSWTARLHDDGFTVGPGGPPATATLEAPALTLLLVLYRRQPLTTPGVTATGDAGLIEFWLENSALE